MKKIFLVRHAKSDWNNPENKDIERPLNDRGYNNANLMSKQFKTIPDLIVSSPAIRAISTALIFARNLNYDSNKIQIKKELYESSVKDYLSVIHQLDNQYNTTMLFAHNPTISDLADSLVKSLPMEMATCAIAGISFECSKWTDIKNKQGELFLFDYPKKNND
ncbi:MAG: putative phosphoserine phosphatase 2 [Bacteroidetes bacterium]|jgi:phosphohistidine phosphatase|nr:putative phosphoserine phosphatase 2 [Bacteroidota bacterium]MDF2451027.1 putative phosphoserine phosphatase 2 [Bacteroidota bacterium]